MSTLGGSRSRWPIVVTAALAVVIGVGIGAWLMRKPPARRETAPARRIERKAATAEASAPKPAPRESQRILPTPAPVARSPESVASPVGAPVAPKPIQAPAPETVAAVPQSPQTAQPAPAPAPRPLRRRAYGATRASR